MKWLDKAWWTGMEHLIGIRCPAAPGEPYRMLILQKDQHRIRVKHSAGEIDLPGVQALLLRHPKWPIVAVLGSDFVMEAILAPDQMSDPVSGVLGVKIDDRDNFEYMVAPAPNGQFHVAVIRKETVQAAIQPLDGDRERIIHISFANSILQAVTPGAGNRAFQWTGAKGQAVANGELQNALTYLWSANPEGSHLPWQGILQNYVAISRLRQIAVVSAAGLAVWFLTLFFLRTRLEAEKNTLEEAYAQNLPVFNAIHKLDEKIEARESLNAELDGQTLRASKASFYLDRLAAITPSDIRLQELIVGPEEEDFKRQGLREPSDHNIILRGESDRSAPVTTFSQAIEATPWIQAIAIPKSELNLQSEHYQFVFLLKTNNAMQ